MILNNFLELPLILLIILRKLDLFLQLIQRLKNLIKRLNQMKVIKAYQI